MTTLWTIKSFWIKWKMQEGEKVCPWVQKAPHKAPFSSASWTQNFLFSLFKAKGWLAGLANRKRKERFEKSGQNAEKSGEISKGREKCEIFSYYPFLWHSLSSFIKTFTIFLSLNNFCLIFLKGRIFLSGCAWVSIFRDFKSFELSRGEETGEMRFLNIEVDNTIDL